MTETRESAEAWSNEGEKMAPIKTTPAPLTPRRGRLTRYDARSAWSTALVFIILLLMTVAMGFLLKGLVTGSLKPF